MIPLKSARRTKPFTAPIEQAADINACFGLSLPTGHLAIVTSGATPTCWQKGCVGEPTTSGGNRCIANIQHRWAQSALAGRSIRGVSRLLARLLNSGCPVAKSALRRWP